MPQYRVELEVVVRAPADSCADHDARQRIFDRFIANLPDHLQVSPEEATFTGGRWQVRFSVIAPVTAASYSAVENGIQTRLNSFLGADRISHTVKKIELVS